MPFDGATHPYEEMCRLIETNFVDYTNDLYFNGDNFYGKNGVVLNHEKTNCIHNLNIQLNERVNQFKMILNSSKKILFLIHNKNKNIDFNFNLLTNALKIYPNLTYNIFIFNNYHSEYIFNTTQNLTYLNIFWNPNNITDFSNLNYDDINHDFTRQMYETPYGIDFSKQVLKHICFVLNEDYNYYILNSNYNFNDSL
jgi:hypothetical protein